MKIEVNENHFWDLDIQMITFTAELILRISEV